MTHPCGKTPEEAWTLKGEGIDDLEPSAWEVVRSNYNCSVVAGPGAGKTELLAQRAAYLLETGICLKPKRILAISFKKDAARNLKKRIDNRCSSNDARRFDSMTFDAFAKGLLDRFSSALPERWRPTGDYEILFPNRDIYSYFIESLVSGHKDPKYISGMRGINLYTFERNYMVANPLPDGPWKNTQTYGDIAAGQWWLTQLKKLAPSRLSFPMIGRLVELLLRTNPLLRRSMQTTYSHVFLDEFQDTTNIQYDLVKTAFQGSECILTAVGDPKQRIMGWAMALDNAFSDFESDFNAQRKELLWNFRSSPELVRIQNQLAQAIDAGAPTVQSKSISRVSGEICAIWQFPTTNSEALHLATVINQGITELGLSPRDFVLLVRQKADDYESTLQPVFYDSGLKLRNEARLVTGIAIQDLLNEAATQVILQFLHLGQRQRAKKYWTDCRNSVAKMWGIHSEDEKGHIDLVKTLNEFHQELQARMSPYPNSAVDIEQIVQAIVGFIGIEHFVQSFPEYRQGEGLKKVIDATSSLLSECCSKSQNWENALISFEGKDSVPLMTIHKCKGLEFHTVYFVGLDDNAWWSFERDRDESIAGFFVSFTRAAQRIFYTYCSARGKKRKIDEIYKLIESAGVPYVSPNNEQ